MAVSHQKANKYKVSLSLRTPTYNKIEEIRAKYFPELSIDRVINEMANLWITNQREIEAQEVKQDVSE
jgi:hypothetical protein